MFGGPSEFFAQADDFVDLISGQRFLNDNDIIL
jgi:hypothetical protein